MFRIVEAVGGMTVAEAEERFSSLEVVDWVAFFRIQDREHKKAMDAARNST